MATLGDAIRDKKGFPDAQEIAIGDLKITLGELRAFQDASGQDVAKQLEADRVKLKAEQEQIARAQEEVVALWTKLQDAAARPPARTAEPAADWTADPLFAPVAKYLKDNIESAQAKQAEQISQFQK